MNASPTSTTRQRHVLISLCILATFLALSLGTALTQIPGTDEGYFANPAFNLLTKGVFATTVLETFASEPLEPSWGSKRDSMISVGFKRVSEKRLPSQ